jgi:hypothetical protein
MRGGRVSTLQASAWRTPTSRGRRDPRPFMPHGVPGSPGMLTIISLWPTQCWQPRSREFARLQFAEPGTFWHGLPGSHSQPGAFRQPSNRVRERAFAALWEGSSGVSQTPALGGRQPRGGPRPDDGPRSLAPRQRRALGLSSNPARRRARRDLLHRLARAMAGSLRRAVLTTEEAAYAWRRERWGPRRLHRPAG